MSTLLIEGGRRLSGTVEVEGNKNAALPLLAACLLTEEECVLRTVPRIGDVEVMSTSAPKSRASAARRCGFDVPR
jgi:UDP-N-acetylglucosamine 1-carboxyvinyltransferase